MAATKHMSEAVRNPMRARSAEPRLKRSGKIPSSPDFAFHAAGLAIHRVFEPLFFHFGVIFPDDLAGARIDQAERIQDVVA